MLKDDKTRTSARMMHQYGPFGFVLFIAFVGALVYFSQHAHNFGEALLSIGKAIVWPGFVVYHVLQLIGA
jgi:hypothetical protein